MESDLNNPSTPLPDSQQNASQPQQSASQPRQNASQPRQNASPQQNASQPQQSASQPAAQSNASDDSQTPQQKVLKQVVNWQNLHFYQKSDVLYQLTCAFCRRFLPLCGDRTVDQMVQAARSCKQNIVEGSEDGATSSETEIKLINVARSSNDELREDYLDFIKKQNLPLWAPGHERFTPMQEYTRHHNVLEDYLPYVDKWLPEEFANTCLTLCYQVDAMMNHYLKRLEKQFIEQGGIKERMYAARTGYRKQQDEKMKQLEAENASLKAENASLKAGNESLKAENAALTDDVAKLQARYDNLRERALAAYYRQQEEIKQLKQQPGEQL